MLAVEHLVQKKLLLKQTFKVTNEQKNKDGYVASAKHLGYINKHSLQPHSGTTPKKC